jgi:hypothetical protein
MKRGWLIVGCLAWVFGGWALPANAESPVKPGSGERPGRCSREGACEKIGEEAVAGRIQGQAVIPASAHMR